MAIGWVLNTPTELGGTPQPRETVSPRTLYYGAIIGPQERNPKESISYNAWPRCLLEVSEEGKLVRIVPHVSESDIQDTLKREGLGNSDVIFIPRGEFLMPGFIDTHTVSYLSLNGMGIKTNF